MAQSELDELHPVDLWYDCNQSISVDADRECFHFCIEILAFCAVSEPACDIGNIEKMLGVPGYCSGWAKLINRQINGYR